jgi:hypothetical protein
MKMGTNVCSFGFDGVDVDDFEAESFAALVADDLEFEGVNVAKRVFLVDGLAGIGRSGGVALGDLKFG